MARYPLVCTPCTTACFTQQQGILCLERGCVPHVCPLCQQLYGTHAMHCILGLKRNTWH
jgi:hypothetical protein